MTERDGFRIQLPKDPEALRLLEAREEDVEGGEPACLLGRGAGFADEATERDGTEDDAAVCGEGPARHGASETERR